MAIQLEAIQRSFYQGQLPATIQQALQGPIPPEQIVPIRLLLLRSLLLQGRYRQAEQICTALLENIPNEQNDLSHEIRCWSAFLQIYLVSDPLPSISVARTLLLEMQTSSLSTARVKILLGKMLALAANWLLLPATVMQEARAVLGEALQHYRAAQAQQDTFEVLLSLGQFFLAEPALDRSKARSLFLQAQEEGRAAGDLVQQAKAQCCLAELDFDEKQETDAKITAIALDVSSYQVAHDLFEQAGCVLGIADVLLSLGRRLLQNGHDGTQFLQEALKRYQQEENLLGIYSAVNGLGSWYVQQGILPRAFEYHQQSVEITQEMGFPLGQAISAMALGDYYSRVANYAKALSYYEQAESLVMLRVVGAMVGLLLANAYLLMRLPDRAMSASQRAIDVLCSAGPSANLSLARYIRGIALTGKGDWAGAIVVWREGLTEDGQRKDWLSMAQKLQCIAQALVMQYSIPGGPPVPEEAYAESMTTYTQAIALLGTSQDPQSLAVIANTYQLQGQSAIACNRPADANTYLERARDLYGKLHLAMQFATTTVMIGLLYYDLGKRGGVDAYQHAIRYYEEALDYFRQARMLDWTWKLAFFIAQILFISGNQALTGEERHQQWQKAIIFLENAAADIEFVRGTFIETSTIATQEAQVGLLSDKEKVYECGILLHRSINDVSGAFTWLERLKGRSFLDALALTELHPPIQTSALIDALLAREREAFSVLRQTKTQTEAVEIIERLHRLWDEMSADPTTREYVALRRGEPRTKSDIDALLKI